MNEFKSEDYTNFWDYALGESPFSDEDVAELRRFLEDNHASMPLDNPQVYDTTFTIDEDIPF